MDSVADHFDSYSIGRSNISIRPPCTRGVGTRLHVRHLFRGTGTTPGTSSGSANPPCTPLVRRRLGRPAAHRAPLLLLPQQRVQSDTSAAVDRLRRADDALRL